MPYLALWSRSNQRLEWSGNPVTPPLVHRSRQQARKCKNDLSTHNNVMLLTHELSSEMEKKMSQKVPQKATNL